MSLPTGQISISQIMAELGYGSGSLRGLSGYVGFGTPDSMSEFHGYAMSNYQIYQGCGDGVFYYYQGTWGGPKLDIVDYGVGCALSVYVNATYDTVLTFGSNLIYSYYIYSGCGCV